MDKKVQALIEALPRLGESEARRLLEKAGGSLNKASEMALEGGEWNAAPAKKKPVKKEEKKETVAPRRDDKKVDRPRREFVERKPVEVKVEKKVEVKATPSSIVIGATKSKVESGLSFADMIKRQKQPEPVVEAVPEPVVEVAPVQEEVVVTPAAVEEPVAAPVVVEAPKPKKEKKEPKKKTVAPLPQKYEAEIDRVSAVNLPANIVELASNAFTFSSEAGRAPSPPRQVQQQPAHQVHHQQQGDWSHNQRQHQPVQQRAWNQENNNYNNNRNQHFSGDWRNNGRGYDNNMGYNTQRMGGYNQRPDGNVYNNNMAHQRPAQQVQQVQQTQNFW